MSAERRIGVALSGGGYRATAWGLGTMVGLAQARELDAVKTLSEQAPRMRIVSVSSVSGGSLANAAFALHGPDDLNGRRAAELVADIEPMIRHVAVEGLIRYGHATNGSLFATFALVVASVFATFGALGAIVAVDRDWSSRSLVVGGLVVGALLAIVLIVRARRSPTPERVAFAVSGFAIGSGFGLGAAAVVEWSKPWPWIVGSLVVVAVLLWCWSALRLSGRGALVEHAMARGPLAGAPSAERSPVQLASLADRRVHHVFCATELQSGDHFFVSPRMTYGFQLGWSSSPGSWTLARAVQGSASLPGGFPPQRTALDSRSVQLERWWWVPDSAPDQPAKRIVLVDGGVYDNMGTEWDIGFESRLARLERDGTNPLADVQDPANFLVVANAGKALGWSDIGGGLPLVRELAGLARDQSIQYDQTTATRRRALVSLFRAAEAGAPDLPMGVIVQASSSPLAVARTVARDLQTSPEGKRQRAQQWIEVLEALDVDWAQIARSDAAVPTVLSALGPERTVSLLWHAAVLTQVQLHIHYGIGTPQPVERTVFADAFKTG